MGLRTFVFAVVALVGCYGFVNGERRTRICVAKSPRTTIRIHATCRDLDESNSTVACVIDFDRFSCLRRVIAGEADFTVLEPEDLVAAVAYTEYNVLITHELRLFQNDKHGFDMVAIVHKNVQHMWDLKGKRFCYPGIDIEDDWTKTFSMYFENWVIPKKCDPDKTLLENRIYSLSKHFEAACIAGPWSSDTTFDLQLKSKYRNLCAACDSPNSCSNNDKYHGREGALLCLTDNAGDVAWVRLDDAHIHFKNEDVKRQDYNYLCSDGTIKPDHSPCSWISKPWPVIVASPLVAEKVSRTMNALKKMTLSWEQGVLRLLEGFHISPVNTEILETPEDYLGRFVGFMSAFNRASCQPSRRVLWCVTSNLEDRKCRWLREAAIVYGVEPPISCIQERESKWSSCLDALQSGRADVFVARPDELLQAREKGLKPIVYATSNKKQELYRFAAVVKYDSEFKTLRDLEGAKACFTGYKSVGWNAFVSTIRNASAEKWGCLDAQIVSNFFKESCVFNLSRKRLRKLNIEDKSELPANLYSLCKPEEIEGDDISAFDCLTSGRADVAFVNLKAIEKKTGNFGDKHDENKKYRILCLDEPEKPGSCLLTWTPFGAVIARENITSLRREEIYMMLLDMDHLFGTVVHGQAPTLAFSLYENYDNVSNVIFPEETRHLISDSPQMPRVRSYDQIMEGLLRQKACSTASDWISHFPGIFSLCMAVVTLSRFLNC